MHLDSGTYSQSGQQGAPSDQRVLVISSNFNPEVSFLKQLQLRFVTFIFRIGPVVMIPVSNYSIDDFPSSRSSCPNNNAVTLRCTGTQVLFNIRFATL